MMHESHLSKCFSFMCLLVCFLIMIVRDSNRQMEKEVEKLPSVDQK